jgi:hypothetical protein
MLKEINLIILGSISMRALCEKSNVFKHIFPEEVFFKQNAKKMWLNLGMHIIFS